MLKTMLIVGIKYSNFDITKTPPANFKSKPKKISETNSGISTIYCTNTTDNVARRRPKATRNSV